MNAALPVPVVVARAHGHGPIETRRVSLQGTEKLTPIIEEDQVKMQKMS